MFFLLLTVFVFEIGDFNHMGLFDGILFKSLLFREFSLLTWEVDHHSVELRFFEKVPNY